MFKGRRTVEFSYPIDEEFFEEGTDGDDGEFGDDDALSQSEAYSRLRDLSSDGMCIKPFKMVLKPSAFLRWPVRDWRQLSTHKRGDKIANPRGDRAHDCNQHETLFSCVRIAH